MAAPEPQYTVKWALFSFKGRLSRKSFWLASLLLVLVNAALVAALAGLAPAADGTAAILGLALIALWLASAWAILALAVKRLHDIGLPGPLAILLLFPAISFLAFLFLAVVPSTPKANEHGPVPFPRN